MGLLGQHIFKDAQDTLLRKGDQHFQGPNPYAAEFVPGSTSYGHESAEFVADPDEQWFAWAVNKI